VVFDPAAIDRLRRAFGDEGPGIVAELVATFLAESPARLEALGQGVAAGDRAGVRRAAHSLRSGAATLGAVDLASVCRVVEGLGEAGELSAAADLVPAVEAEYGRARVALEAAVE
jgi:HPt (histidine-containing phosphotransfer) domain-containing protein